MPGQRKEEDHREALLRNSLESSSSAGLSASPPMLQAHPHPSRVLETEASLQNAVSSERVIRLEPDGGMNPPKQCPDTIEEGSAARHSAANLQPFSAHPLATLPAPSPSQARISTRAPASVHPLSSDQQSNLNTAADVSSSFSEYIPPTSPGQGGGTPLGGQADETQCARSASVLREGTSGLLAPFVPECRICLLSEPPGDLVVPCHCTGSLAYTHMGCLKTWVMEKRAVHCELCGTMYKEPYGSELAASIPPAPPPPQLTSMRRFTTPEGQPIIIMPVGVNLGPGVMGPFLEHHPGLPHAEGPTLVAGVTDARELEPQPLCEWRNMWSYALILLLLLFAIIYVTVISKRGKPEPWMMTLWQVLLVVLPIYLVLRVAFDLYRHRLAQQLAAANLQAMAIANLQANAAADAAAVAGQTTTPATGGAPQREVIITRAGNRLLVVQRTVP